VLGELLEEGWNEGFGGVEMRLGMKSYDIGSEVEKGKLCS
jgi:hypothetical protein